MLQKIEKYLIIGLVVCLAVSLYEILGRHDKQEDKTISSPVLQKDEKEKIIINQAKHEATIIQDIKGREETKTVYINPRGPVSITENNNGSIKILQRNFGMEKGLGIGVDLVSSLSPRFSILYWGFYFKRFDFGVGASAELNKQLNLDLPIFVGYNFYKDFSLTAGYGPLRKEFQGGISIRVF